MKLFSTFLFLSFLAACNNHVVPLKGAYQDTVYQVAATTSKQQTWDKLIDLLTAKGLAIKTLDQNNGLITTESSSFLNNYAFEKKEGGLTNPNAYVVCTKVRGGLTLPLSIKPQSVNGQWILRLKDNGDKTNVDVRLANANGTVIVGDMNKQSENKTYSLIVKSTGTFEREIAQALH
jgi:hypothetical protein